LAAVSAVVLLPQSATGAAITIDPQISGTRGANGWYVSDVVVRWTYSPPPIKTEGCDVATITTPGANLDCKVWWGMPGPFLDYPLTIHVDKAAPVVRAVPQRPPDSNGWYNHKVAVSFSGTDATSGVASCTSTAYAGPDNSAVSISGTCKDRAGNVGGGSLRLAYDSTPPKLKKLRVKNSDHAAIFKWQVSPDTQRVVITRTPGRKKRGASSTVYSGKASSFRDKGLHVGTHYRYTVSVFDAAANKVSRTVRMTGTGKLFAPAPGASVKRAPRLQWAAVRGATYYNVLLVRNGTIFSAWPKGTSLKLPRSWLYHGKRFRLHRGVYRWYVWPGFGARSASKYGGMVGRSSFFFAG
jgi:hypothetical protein